MKLAELRRLKKKAEKIEMRWKNHPDMRRCYSLVWEKVHYAWVAYRDACEQYGLEKSGGLHVD